MTPINEQSSWVTLLSDACSLSRIQCIKKSQQVSIMLSFKDLAGHLSIQITHKEVLGANAQHYFMVWVDSPLIMMSAYELINIKLFIDPKISLSIAKMDIP